MTATVADLTRRRAERGLLNLAERADELPGPWLVCSAGQFVHPALLDVDPREVAVMVEDLVTAVRRRDRLRAGSTTWREEYPDFTCPFPAEAALEQADEDVRDALDALVDGSVT